MSYGYIYLIKDHFTNKVYVGQRKNWNHYDQLNYFGSGAIIKPIIKKRKHHLSKIILGFCESKEELNEAEKTCIEFYQSNNKFYGYNLTIGGETTSGYKHSDISKIKMSNNRKGTSAWNKGLTNETDERVKRCSIKAGIGQKLKRTKYISPNKGKFGSENSTAKPIIQLDLDGNIIKKYGSMVDAARENGFSCGNISTCCNGKSKQAYGFKWQFF